MLTTQKEKNYIQTGGYAKISVDLQEIGENSNEYAKVSNAKELEEAINNSNIKVIEIENDLDLGINNIKEELSTDIITAHNVPLTHPDLIKSGVSRLKIKDRDQLKIYSKNGATILHCNIVLENCNDIIIANLKFDELWEWDEETFAKYDRNNWDYITVQGGSDIWIDHCDFGKSYDGIIDIVKETKNITISWCKVEPNVESEFYHHQFEHLEQNKSQFPMYQYLREEVGLEIEEIENLVSCQFKVHLVGAEDNEEENGDIRLTLHHNIYENVKSRIPRIRNGRAHVYNIIVNSSKVKESYQNLNKEQIQIIANRYPELTHFETYAVIATNNANVIVENSIFENVERPFFIYQNAERYAYGNISVRNSILEEEGREQKIDREVQSQIKWVLPVNYSYSLDEVNILKEKR